MTTPRRKTTREKNRTNKARGRRRSQSSHAGESSLAPAKTGRAAAAAAEAAAAAAGVAAAAAAAAAARGLGPGDAAAVSTTSQARSETSPHLRPMPPNRLCCFLFDIRLFSLVFQQVPSCRSGRQVLVYSARRFPIGGNGADASVKAAVHPRRGSFQCLANPIGVYFVRPRCAPHRYRTKCPMKSPIGAPSASPFFAPCRANLASATATRLDSVFPSNVVATYFVCTAPFLQFSVELVFSSRCRGAWHSSCRETFSVLRQPLNVLMVLLLLLLLLLLAAAAAAADGDDDDGDCLRMV